MGFSPLVYRATHVLPGNRRIERRQAVGERGIEPELVVAIDRFSANAARILSVQVQCFEVKDSLGLARVLASTVDAKIDGLVVVDRSWMARVDYQQVQTSPRRTDSRRPARFRPFTDVGGLFYYGPRRGQADATGAALVDKILRGAKRTGLPVEGPRWFTFVINLKTAKAIGLTIAPSVLAHADEIIQ